MVGFTRTAFQRMAASAAVTALGGSAAWSMTSKTKNESDDDKTVMSYLSEIHSKVS